MSISVAVGVLEERREWRGRGREVEEERVADLSGNDDNRKQKGLVKMGMREKKRLYWWIGMKRTVCSSCNWKDRTYFALFVLFSPLCGGLLAVWPEWNLMWWNSLMFLSLSGCPTLLSRAEYLNTCLHIWSPKYCEETLSIGCEAWAQYLILVTVTTSVILKVTHCVHTSKSEARLNIFAVRYESPLRLISWGRFWHVHKLLMYRSCVLPGWRINVSAKIHCSHM